MVTPEHTLFISIVFLPLLVSSVWPHCLLRRVNPPHLRLSVMASTAAWALSRNPRNISGIKMNLFHSVRINSSDGFPQAPLKCFPIRPKRS